MIRTRFAPSPTGSLHVGNARVAVLNWLFARHHRGAFVLRIEDTDAERNLAGAEAALRADLEWLGLEWDEGPGVEGPHGEGPFGPYRQSERLESYREHAQRLLDDGRAFHCYCTPAELEGRRKAALERGENPHYDGTCRRLAAAAAARLRAEGRRAAVRFHVGEEGHVEVRDLVRGTVRVPRSEIGDFILLRSDGLPTYNFAVVVDDALMEISHVIRGSGHLSNTPRQRLLFDALGFEAPLFVHVPMVLGPDRQKLSKRHGARALVDYRREGLHPDALLNYLSLLSWSSPSGDEFLTRDRLINEVSLERIGAADVIFDEAKLRWLSARHIAEMPLPDLLEAILPFLDRERFPIPDEVLPAALAAVRTHLSTFAGINDLLEPFLGRLDLDGLERRAALVADDTAMRVLRDALATLPGLEAWEEETLARALKDLAARTGVRGRTLYEPLRIALTGRPHGPPLAAVLYVLGRATALRLLEEAAAGAGGQNAGRH